jgi:hypothetical protein
MVSDRLLPWSGLGSLRDVMKCDQGSLKQNYVSKRHRRKRPCPSPVAMVRRRNVSSDQTFGASCFYSAANVCRLTGSGIAEQKTLSGSYCRLASVSRSTLPP